MAKKIGILAAAVAAAGLWAAGAGWAAEPAAESKKAAAAPAVLADRQAEVAGWVAKLGDGDGDVRQQATDALRKIGKDAVPALAQAAKSDDLEVATRAESLLKKIEEDAKPRPTARGGGGGFGDGLDGGDWIVGGNAAAGGRVRVFRVGPGGGGNVQVRMHAVGGANGQGVSITRSDVNGVKAVKVTEGQRKVTIDEDPAKGIKVTVTEPDKDGKPQTQTYEAKDADALKKESPDGHKVYEKYMGGGGVEGLRLEINGLDVKGGAGGAAAGAAAAGGENTGVADVRGLLEAQRQMMREQMRMIEARARAGGQPDADDLRATIETMRDLQRQLMADRDKALGGGAEAGVAADAVDARAMLEDARRQLIEARKLADQEIRRARDEVEKLRKEIEEDK